MTDQLLDDLRGIDPLPHGFEPPSLTTMHERLDLSIRPLDAPLAREPRPGHRRHPTPRVTLAGAALAGAAVAVTLALTNLGGGRLDVAAAALRATEPGPGVVHMRIVSELTVGTGGHLTTSTREIWTAQSPRRIRSVQTGSGETREGALTTAPVRSLTWSSTAPGVIKESVPQGVLLKEDSPVRVIHDLIAEGAATATGKTTYEGREAWQLRIHPQTAPPLFEGVQLPDPTLLVDATSFAPLELIEHFVTSENGKPELAEQRERYVEYAELPADAQHEALLELAPHPGARIERER